jgi:hypothetical protein
MKYRYRLGRDQETNILNEQCTAIGSWNGFGGNWSQAGSLFQHANNSWDFIYLSNVYTVGDIYKVVIKFDNTDTNAICRHYIGDYSISDFEVSPDSAEHTWDYDSICVRGNRLVIAAYGNVDIDYIEIYSKDWNDPLDSEATDWEETSIKISKSDRFTFNDLFFSYSSNLGFYNDGYDYILSRYNTQRLSSPKEFLCLNTY